MVSFSLTMNHLNWVFWNYLKSFFEKISRTLLLKSHFGHIDSTKCFLLILSDFRELSFCGPCFILSFWHNLYYLAFPCLLLVQVDPPCPQTPAVLWDLLVQEFPVVPCFPSAQDIWIRMAGIVLLANFHLIKNHYFKSNS